MSMSTRLQAGDPGPVEPAHALGVDELAADPQPGEEGAGHAGAALVEELDERDVGAHGDDERGRPCRRPAASRRPRWCPWRGRPPARPRAPAPARARGAAVAVGVHDDLGAAAQRVVGHRVHVADDEVGLVPGLDERVGAAVDADEDRLVLADVVAQGLQVLLVVVAAHDDEGVPAVEVGADVGHADAVEEQLALLAQVVHGVRRRTPRAGRTGPARASVMALLDGLVVEHRRGGDGGLVGAHRALLERQLGAVLDRHDVRAGAGRAAGCRPPPGSRDRGSGSARRSTTPR